MKRLTTAARRIVPSPTRKLDAVLGDFSGFLTRMESGVAELDAHDDRLIARQTELLTQRRALDAKRTQAKRIANALRAFIS